MKAYLLSLGCPKNLVDSEFILSTLKNSGYEIIDQVDDEQTIELAVVNTCGFIKDAKEESINSIIQLGRMKQSGRLKTLIVAGCLAQRYQQELVEELPEVDGFWGTGNLSKLCGLIKNVKPGKKICNFDNPGFLEAPANTRRWFTPSHFAYIKIAEGCNNRCHYCIIPYLKGPYRSRPIESIVGEAGQLAQSGLVEVNLISQDSACYGTDLYGKSRTADLLRELDKTAGIKWIRLLYNHPAHINDDLVRTIAELPGVCKYIDLPLQHINNGILNNMGRKITKQKILALLEKLRKNISGLTLRTTFIVGLPGEGDKEFRELLEFIQEVKFERLGAFIYSREEGTLAAGYTGQVPEHVKQQRFDQLMSLQQDIAAEINNKFKNRVVPVLIDEKDSRPGWYIGRTQADAPEVDGQIFVKASTAYPGQILEVKVTDTYEYDLVGEVLGQERKETC